MLHSGMFPREHDDLQARYAAGLVGSNCAACGSGAAGELGAPGSCVSPKLVGGYLSTCAAPRLMGGTRQQCAARDEWVAPCEWVAPGSCDTAVLVTGTRAPVQPGPRPPLEGWWGFGQGGVGFAAK